MSVDINLEKLKYDLFVIYGQYCLINKTGYDNVVHSIIPYDILSLFNYRPFTESWTGGVFNRDYYSYVNRDVHNWENDGRR